jgi:ATP adenylyltransferase/5',5'''-P-1,P-4-tetraphosphate phosphorylase II
LKDINQLYSRQLNEWEFARQNYEGLKNVTIKTFQISRHKWHVQFNPKRIVSTAAKIDQKSLSDRPCFLCENNRPPEQEGLSWQEYTVLLNPYPVFDRHFTIPTIEHVPQLINGRFRDMLSLARELEDSVIIYNGPKCGASAPDHMHFQSIPQNLLPVETGFLSISTVQGAVCGNTILYRWEDFLSHPVTLAGDNLEELARIFQMVYNRLKRQIIQPVRVRQHLTELDHEPMFNMLTLYNRNRWIVHVFPRRSHRPRQYFADEPEKIFISPGSIDMGGVLVMPREEDYKKITASDIVNIMEQVCMDEEFIINLINEIKKEYDSI